MARVATATAVKPGFYAGRGGRSADLARGCPQGLLPHTIRAMAPFVLAVALMPWPSTIELRDGRLAIDDSFAVAVRCADPRVNGAAERLIQRMLRQTGLPRMGGSDAKLIVECAARGNDYPAVGEDESYTLEITDERATLRAPAGVGALRGLETFAQAIVVGTEGFEVPAMRVEDRPRFPWRGLMIDASRHWMPLDLIVRNLDAMAAVKLNVFHWHLSDDQGFRVESKRWPKLHELGSEGLYYTQEQVREVVEYARRARHPRHSRVRHPGPHTVVARGVSGAGERARAVLSRPRVGRLRTAHGPYPGGDLSVSGRVPLGSGGAVSRPLLPHRRRRGQPEALEGERANHGVRPGARAERAGGLARLFQPADRGDSGEAGQEHDRLGRDPASRVAGGRDDPVLARRWGAGRRGAERSSGGPLVGLLSRSPGAGELPLCGQSPGRSGGAVGGHGRGADPRRRGLHVDRKCEL